MSMLQHSTRAWGSPSRYIQGRYELESSDNAIGVSILAAQGAGLWLK